MKSVNSKFSIRKSAEYLAFWGVSMVVLAYHFAYGPVVERIDWIYTLLFHLSLWIGVSVNSFVLIPQFLASKRYVVYAFAFMMVISATVFLNQLTFTHVADWLFPGYFFISYFEWYDLLVYVLAYLGITSLIQFSRSWFAQAEAQKSIAELRKAKMEQELRSLKSQVQPHFLFNSLNTIYGLVRRKSDKAGDAILTLSDLLRYTIRHSESSWVPLSDELEYLNQYLDLQRLRTDYPEKLVLKTDFSGKSPEEIKILPLLFLAFIENAIKYGDGEVISEFMILGNELIFRCSNPIIIDKTISGTGTGIENSRKLMDLMYQGNYSLQILPGATRFEVELRLPLDPNLSGEFS